MVEAQRGGYYAYPGYSPDDISRIPASQHPSLAASMMIHLHQSLRAEHIHNVEAGLVIVCVCRQ